ncbi:hypothetical protein SLEP1_g59788 [Rubroshorea leprosula]|uniref:Uncharacterized protein n=1 Tax=Rubroshorea leprosula TaxID=152421 RepID=A0AAV5MUW8_9ROSI|nr:hypothetical protein SLEP1_g59788 [Rubroshorea leprosula]
MHALGYNFTHIITLEHIHVPSSFIHCLASIRTRTNSSLEDQKFKHIALYMALAIKGFIKERDATTH